MSNKLNQTLAYVLSLDNRTLQEIEQKIKGLPEKRKKNLLKAINERDLDLLDSYRPLFVNEYLHREDLKMIAGLDFSIQDSSLLKKLFQYSIFDDDKTKILENYFSCSLKDNAFYQSVKQEYPDELQAYLHKKFAKDGLSGSCLEVFREFIENNNQQLKLDHLRIYTDVGNEHLLDYIFENNRFHKIIKSNISKLIIHALGEYNERSTQKIFDYGNQEKKASLIFYDDTNSMNFCKNSSEKFFDYFMKNFEFDHQEMMYLFHYLPKVNSHTKWISAVEALVSNHLDDEHFIEQIKRRIEAQKNDFPKIVMPTFNYHKLGNQLEEKNTTKKIKI